MENTGLERIIRLIGLLIGNKRTTAELAEMLECDLRTVQRYIRVLRDSGFIIESFTRGVPFLSPRKGRLKDISDLVHFNHEEAFILRKAIDSITGENMLKQNLKKKLYSIYNFPELVEITVKPELGENVHCIIEAIHDEKAVRLAGYHSANSNTISDRVVEPYQFTTNYAQVWAYDLSDRQCKLFSVARITEVQLLEQPWQHKKHHVAAGLDVFRNSGFRPVGKVLLQLNIRAVSLLTEEYPLAEKHLSANDDFSSMFEAEVYNFEGPARFVLGLYDNIHILGDNKFIDFVNRKIISMKKSNDSICR
jgi:predicted DNA-binding transcriptional regulator YafY